MKCWISLVTPFAIVFLTLAGLAPLCVADSDSEIVLGEEYESHARERTVKKEQERSLIGSVLLYLPNRIIDFVDIFKVDVGAGPATGVVVRLTKWGQVGYRTMAPASLRVGIRGREIPVFIERSSELGVGPAFLQSHDREVTTLEIGAGADLFLAGAYVGVSIDEFFDFLGGWVGIDFKNDDF